MLISNKRNWKTYLNLDDESILNDILKMTARHRGAYKNASDVGIAQLWCALIELEKQIRNLDTRLARIERILNGIVTRASAEKEELIKTLERL
jgi:hypothetical protein